MAQVRSRREIKRNGEIYHEIVFENGNIYKGQLQDERMHGRGLWKSATGNVYYLGEFNKGDKHGRGLFKFHDGDVYEGEYKDNQRNGRGVIHFSNGDVYEGQHEKGMRHGYGTFYFGDTHSVYCGNWSEDLRSGKGILTLVDGSILEATYVNDSRLGPAEFRGKDGRIWRGEFEEHYLSRGVLTFANGDTLQGQWEGNDFKNGRGDLKMTYKATGQTVLGIWKACVFTPSSSHPLPHPIT